MALSKAARWFAISSNLMEVMEERVWEGMSEEAMISKKCGVLEKYRTEKERNEVGVRVCSDRWWEEVVEID